jgi:myosin heavy subunit
MKNATTKIPQYIWLEDKQDVYTKAELLDTNLSTEIVRVKDIKTGAVFNIGRDKIFTYDSLLDESKGDISFLDPYNYPSILNIIKLRYQNEMIFTRISPIILSINPNKNIKSTFDHLLYESYSDEVKCCHVFDITSTCINELQHTNQNQTILIKGISGSGKSVVYNNIVSKLLYDLNLYDGSYHDSTALNKPPPTSTETTCTTSSSTNRNIVYDKFNALTNILQSFGNISTTNCSSSTRFCNLMKLNCEVQYYIVVYVQLYNIPCYIN